MELGAGKHSQTLPGLKLSSPYNKLLSLGEDKAALPPRVPLTCDRPPSIHLPVWGETHSPSLESSSLVPDPVDPSTPGNITIPRPHGRKTPELGSVLVVPVVQSHSKTSRSAEGGTTPGGQEFRQALSMSTDGDLLKSTKDSEDKVDLIRLLDPLNSAAPSSSTLLSDRVDIGVLGTTHKPSLRSYPQGLSPFPPHPQMTLNPFAQPLQQSSSQMHYSPTVSGNPFSAVYAQVRPGSYLHAAHQPQSFSALPVLYKQHSPGSSALPTNYVRIQSPTSVLHSSASTHTLSSLADTRSAPSTAAHIPATPFCAEGDNLTNHDPFEDLLTMTKPASPPKKKAEDLRRRWETFD